MITEEELQKNNYQYMDHCYNSTKLGAKSIEAYVKKEQLQDEYATVTMPKGMFADIVAKLLNYEHVLWKTNGGEGERDNAWDIGDLYEAIHDCITDAGYKVYERDNDNTPKDCKLEDCYVI